MTSVSTELPDDIEVLKELVRARDNALAQKDEQLRALQRD